LQFGLWHQYKGILVASLRSLELTHLAQEQSRENYLKPRTDGKNSLFHKNRIALMQKTPVRKNNRAPLSPEAKRAKQARIDKALSKYTEWPEYPENLYQRILGDAKRATGAIFALDQMIARLNQSLHQAQGVRPGKISIRYTRLGGSGIKAQDRVPNAVVWFGGDGPTVYKKVDERLTRVKVRGITVNRRPIRKILNQMQIILDKRAAIVETLSQFSRATKSCIPGITTTFMDTEKLLVEIPRMLEHDFTKVE
jgi:hypothetical protein